MRKLKTHELNRLDVGSFKEAGKHPIVLVLDNIRSLNNIGSIFRTADAFKLECLYLCGITACPPHRDIHKTALGATDSVDWLYFQNVEDVVIELQQKKYVVIALEQTDKSLMLNDFIVDQKKKYAIILGNEVYGVSDRAIRMADSCIEIPQFGTKHSFNVTVSAGIALWDILLKMNLLQCS